MKPICSIEYFRLVSYCIQQNVRHIVPKGNPSQEKYKIIMNHPYIVHTWDQWIKHKKKSKEDIN